MKEKITSENDFGWKVTGTETLIKTCVMTVTEQKTLSPEGREGSYIVMNAPDWVVVVPKIIENGCEYFLMAEQWRHAAKQICVEFPGGVIDKGEDPETAGKRELLEETGCKAKSLIHLGSMSPNPAIFSNQIHYFAVENPEQTHIQHLDEDEYINVKKIPISEVCKKMGTPPYSHGLMTAALEMYKRKFPTSI